MDLATIIGFVASFGIVAAGILMGGPMGMFVNGASLFIVVLGSLAVVLMRSSLGDFIGAGALAGKAFANKVGSVLLIWIARQRCRFCAPCVSYKCPKH